MKTIPVFRTILKLIIIAFAVYTVGIFLHRILMTEYSWIIVLFLFFKLFTTVLRIFGTIIGTMIGLCWSVLKACLFIYVITLIL